MAYNTVDDLPKHLQQQARKQLGLDLPAVPMPAPPAPKETARGPVGANPKQAAKQKSSTAASKTEAKTAEAPQPLVAGEGSEAGLFAAAGQPKPGGKAQHIPGRMNSTERRYSQVLNERIAAGEIVWWRFESVNFRIGANCYYRPDFMVQLADGSVEIHETKGTFIREDARAKLSVMKEMYPFFIWLCVWVSPNKKKNITGGWDIKPA